MVVRCRFGATPLTERVTVYTISNEIKSCKKRSRVNWFDLSPSHSHEFASPRRSRLICSPFLSWWLTTPSEGSLRQKTGEMVSRRERPGSDCSEQVSEGRMVRRLLVVLVVCGRRVRDYTEESNLAEGDEPRGSVGRGVRTYSSSGR